jgi:hypothetical protein
MCDTARATSWAVTLNKVVVGSASRRRSGDIEIAALAASLIVARCVDLQRTLEAENRIHYKAGAIGTGNWPGKELLKHRIV